MPCRCRGRRALDAGRGAASAHTPLIQASGGGWFPEGVTDLSASSASALSSADMQASVGGRQLGWGGSEVDTPPCSPPPTVCIPGHRMLTFSNNVEPANGFLVRYLRRKLVESDSDVNANREELLRVLDWVPKLWYHLHTFLEKHSTSDFLIGAARASPGRGWGGPSPSRGQRVGHSLTPCLQPSNCRTLGKRPVWSPCLRQLSER